MSISWPPAASWTIRGIETMVTLQGGGALLVIGATGLLLSEPVPVSREMAEKIGAAERAERAKLIVAAHGGSVTLPTPSPFLDERYVRSLPNQAQLDAHRQLAPHAVPGWRQCSPTTRRPLRRAVSTRTSIRIALPRARRPLGDTV